KCYWIAVRLRGSEWLLTAREWDKTLRTFGPIREARAFDRRTLADAATALLEQVFSPLLVVEDADKDSKITTLILRAGSLPFGDAAFVPLSKGDVLLAYFRFVSSKREVRKIQGVPWTYLVVDQIADGR